MTDPVLLYLRALPSKVWTSDELIQYRQRELEAAESEAQATIARLMWLKTQGVTNSQVAAEAGITPGTLSRLVRGARWGPSLEAVRRAVDKLALAT